MPKTPKPPKLDRRLTIPQLSAELDAAEAAIERGESVSHESVVRWAKSLGTPKPLPMPVSRKRRLRAS
ncbi:MAG: hypothetical protein ACKO1J_10390 [Tagaea sp.]